MFLIVGLGNPGSQYQMTRHNIGFTVIDSWAQSLNAGSFRNEHKAETKKIKLELKSKSSTNSNTDELLSKEIIIAKPQTFMNKSGDSVLALMQFYKISKENLLVVHDDIDQSFGSLKFHKNRGHGGQNGIRHISEVLGSQDYARLKVGVGRPSHPGFQVADYVLSGFNKTESPHLKQIIEKCLDGIECFIFKGINQASTDFNGQINLNT